MSTRLAVVRLDQELPLPARAHPGDAGVDLFSAVDVELGPGHRELVPTGLAVAIPEGMVGLVHPRSGLAARVGLSIVNSPGTIDAGYRGEIKVSLINLDPTQPIRISRGIGSHNYWFSVSNFRNLSRCNPSTRPGWAARPVATEATAHREDMRVSDGVR